MKTAISLPDRLFKSSDRAARKMGVSRSRFFTDAVTRYLNDLERSAVTERLNEVYNRLETKEGAVPETLAKLQLHALEKESW